MANISSYPTATPASTDLVLGNYMNASGISETKTFTVASIAASGSATSLNDLTDCLIDTGSAYIGTVPSGLSGNPQGNTTLGIGAGDDITTGNKNTLIGSNAGSTLTTAQNSIVIGYDAEPSTATTSNEITLGNANITSLRIPGLQSGATDGDVLTFSSSTNNITLKSASAAITKLIPYFQIATPGGSDTYTQSNNVVDFDWSGGSGTYEYILPSATAIPYRTIRFVNNSTITASNKIHITAPGTETIDGGAFYEINKAYNGCAVWSDGAQWIVIQAKA